MLGLRARQTVGEVSGATGGAGRGRGRGLEGLSRRAHVTP